MQDLGPSPYTDPAPPPEPSPFTSYAAPPPPFAHAAPAFAVASSGMLYELRPLSLGEILDRTFSLYRRRFWLFAGLASVAAVITTVSQFLQLSVLHPATRTPPNPGMLARQGATQAGILLGTALVYLCIYGIIQAATVSALTAVYLGEETSIGAAFRAVRGRWFRYILIVLWQFCSAVWLPLVLLIPAAGMLAVPSLQVVGGLLLLLVIVSFVYSVIAFIRNSLGIAVATVENLKVRASMRRSKVLVAGHKARVFAIFLLLWALSLAGGVIVAVTSSAMGTAHGAVRAVLEIVTLLVTFLNNALIGPVGVIGLSVFYFDERVRKEGFDLEFLMLRGAPPEPTPETLPSPFTSEIV